MPELPIDETDAITVAIVVTEAMGSLALAADGHDPQMPLAHRCGVYLLADQMLQRIRPQLPRNEFTAHLLLMMDNIAHVAATARAGLGLPPTLS